MISCRFTDTAEPIGQIVERICGDFDSKARMADSFPTERLVCGYEPAMEDLPEDLVTTVVITHNGGDTLVRTNGAAPGAAVILVDNGSTDGRADVVARRSRHVRVVRLPFNIGAVARNVGVALARTPDVAFSDDDSWWAPGALDKAAMILQRHQDVAAVAAQIFVGLENRPDSVRKEAFLQAGGFDTVVLYASEEERLALDLLANGWELVHAPQVVAHHDPKPSRDRSRRVRLIVRNAILTAVMRRPWAGTLERTAAALRSADGRAGLAAALPRAARGLARRWRVPPRVERCLARSSVPAGEKHFWGSRLSLGEVGTSLCVRQASQRRWAT